ncbi:hypothetical protein K1719_011824 [Acacia pycnantha]|nr:hypothetical protein K1719_011824 [Acacia pycnantha]
MEAFSLLKYWRAASSLPPGAPLPPSLSATTIITIVDFDTEENNRDGDGEFKFTLSSFTNRLGDPKLLFSPYDDLFFKGKLVEVEPSSFVINSIESEPNSKPQFTASLVKSATKFTASFTTYIPGSPPLIISSHFPFPFILLQR